MEIVSQSLHRWTLSFSFVEQQDILELMEEYCKLLAKKYYPNRPIKADPFPVLTWKEAMDTYGIDKPELRVENVKLFRTH